MTNNQSLPDDMTVIEMSGPGGPDVLETARRALPLPRAGEVLVKVAAVGVNGPDIAQRKGHYPAPKGASDLLGLEVSGTVVALGEGVVQWAIGDTLCALTNGGGYAEYVAVDAAHCLPVPETVSLVDAAGLPETYFTVWSNIFHTDIVGGADLNAGETFLVHGGAGGIGTTAIQLGKAFDAKVITTESPEERCAYCKDLGADIVLDYAKDDFVTAVREAGGANVILDIVGGDNIARNIKAASPDARLVQLAFAKGSKVEINLMPVMLKRLHYTGSTLRSRPDTQKAAIAATLLAQVWPLFGQGKLRPVTHTTLPLAKAPEAHQVMESVQHMGKILLVP